MMTLDQLLVSLGFEPKITIIVTFILLLINLFGTMFCSLSAWIFFNKKFKDPSFFYYRLLCLVYIILLIHNMLRLLLYTPQYFPNINSYLSSIFIIYSSFIMAFLFHFEGVLQIAILLDRIKLFSPFVKRHFSARQWIISLAFFLTCFLIDWPVLFASKVSSYGIYYNDDLKKNVTLYYMASSQFSTTSLGRILFSFTVYFLNLFLSVFVGVTLNILSVYLYSSYIRQRRLNLDETNRVLWSSSVNQQAASSTEVNISNFTSVQNALTQKQRKEREIERNMFYMALNLCFISIISRTIIFISYIYYLFFPSLKNSFFVFIFNSFIYILVPTLAIFVFYSFNKIFRNAFNKKILRRGGQSMHSKVH